MSSIHLMESICIEDDLPIWRMSFTPGMASTSIKGDLRERDQRTRQSVQQGQLTDQTYVWKQGMPQWQMAGEVMELAPLFQGVAPQMPPMPGMH